MLGRYWFFVCPGKIAITCLNCFDNFLILIFKKAAVFHGRSTAALFAKVYCTVLSSGKIIRSFYYNFQLLCPVA